MVWPRLKDIAVDGSAKDACLGPFPIEVEGLLTSTGLVLRHLSGVQLNCRAIAQFLG